MYGVLDVCFRIQGDYSIIYEKGKEFSTDHPSNALDVFRLALHSLNTLDEQHPLLLCVDGLQADGREAEVRMQSLECQVAVHPAELASVHNDKTWLTDSAEISPHQLADAQLNFLAVYGKCYKYRCRLGIEEHRRGVLEA